MDAQTYALSKLSIKQLRIDDYTKSYVVAGLNLVMLWFAVSWVFSGYLLLYITGVCLWALQMMNAYLIVHECAHNTFFKQKKMNDRCGMFFALFALMPFYSRRLEHLTHHRMPGTFDEPSAQRALKRFKFINPRMAKFLTVCWKLWIPIFAFNEHVMIWALPFKKNAPRKVFLSGLAAVTIYGLGLFLLCFVIPHGIMMLAMFFPAFYLYMVLVEYFNLPHHLTAPIEDRHGTVPYHEQSYYSRSCSPLPAPLDSWLLLNFNYHIAHHLYPAVHWSKIAEAHKIMTKFDPSLGETHSEFEVNTGLRKKPIREALAKYYEHQFKTEGQTNPL